MQVKSINYLSIVGIIGAILLIVGVFLTWASITIPGILGLSSTTYDFTGMDFFNKVDGVADGTQYTYVPLVALVLGILSLVGMIITIFDVQPLEKVNKYIGLVVFVLSIVALVLLLLFYLQSFDYSIGSVTASMKFTDVYDIGVGFWLTLAGSIITVVGGLLPAVQGKLKH